jgi:protein O-GlcNAc transferase
MTKKNKNRTKITRASKQPIDPQINFAYQSIQNAFQHGQLAQALSLLQQALNAYPHAGLLWQLAVMIYATSGHLNQAEAAAHQALKLEPSAARYYDLGLVLQYQQRWPEAEVAQRHAITLNPSYAEAHNNLGLILHEQQRYLEAIAAYRQAIRYHPQYARSYTNLGVSLDQIGALTQAREAHQHALRLNPGMAEAYNNLASTLAKQEEYEHALAACEKALQLNPNIAEIYHTLAGIYADTQKLDHAIAAYREVLRRKPNLIEATGGLLHTQLKICAWQDWQVLVPQLEQAVAQQQGKIHPFILLHISDDPALQQRCARQFAQNYFNFKHGASLNAVLRVGSDKLRIGYLSSDFRSHPVTYLMVEVLELHQRDRFELFAYSSGPDDNSAISQRIKASFTEFYDIRALSLQELAHKIHADKIDILVDLSGYTAHSRSAVLCLRPAPIQVQFLGYSSTLGTSWCDYLIADERLIPPTHFEYYDENIVYLPHTYMPCDRKRSLSPKPCRSAAGLPETGLVWGCFNTANKITPHIFALWMRLLKAVPESVLWLKKSTHAMQENLRTEAQAQGIDRQRLIFAEPTPLLADHLGRLQLADLILDTFPYGAHTSMNDALWAGVPVITCIGQSFVSRVGASLLYAVGLPELITDNLTDYENLALELAQNPAKLAELKNRLKENRDTCALFDTPRYVRNLEKAYQMMYERATQNLPPTHLRVGVWNEWAEGNYLEPDMKYGLDYLEALNHALMDYTKNKKTDNKTIASYPLDFPYTRILHCHIETLSDTGFLVAAMITADEKYYHYAQRLVNSCLQFGLAIVVYEVPTVHRSISAKGSDDVRFTKANFISFLHQIYAIPILYLDVDVVIKQIPSVIPQLITQGYDFAAYNWFSDRQNCCYSPQNVDFVEKGVTIHTTHRFYKFTHQITLHGKDQLLVSGCTQFYNNTKHAEILLKEWHSSICQFPTATDDSCLDFAFNNLPLDSGIKAFWLDKSYARYCWWLYTQPVIDHPDLPALHDSMRQNPETNTKKRNYPERLQQIIVPPVFDHEVLIDVVQNILWQQDADGIFKPVDRINIPIYPSSG